MTNRVFLDYDRPALDAQYNNRGKVPGFESIIEQWVRRSERARTVLPARLEIAYGASPAETLNVFPAQVAGPSPVLVFIHGGYWMSRSKLDTDFVALGLVPHGITVVNIEYALMPGVRMDEAVRQCRSAVAWAIREAAALGADPHRVWVAGHSAGGHLTAMVAATDWDVFFEAERRERGLAVPLGRPAGGLGLSGLYDLEPIRLCYLNDTLGLSPQEAAANSPIQLAAPASGLWRLQVGSLEGPEYFRQTWELASRWASARARAVTAELTAGDDHFTIATRLHDPRDPLTLRLVRDIQGR